MALSAQKQTTILPEPSAELKLHSAKLVTLVQQEIKKNGVIPFAQYMEMALYQPGLGYYSAGLHKFGAAGDFITAPELGSLFAQCLSKNILAVAEKLTAPEYNILEIGAGSGVLAADLLSLLEPAPQSYLILERSADLRQQQRLKIEAQCPQMLSRVEWLDTPPENFSGIIFANEVADALPVERFRIEQQQVLQQVVDLENESLVLRWTPATTELADAVEKLQLETPSRLADGYESEICLLLKPWLSGLLESLDQGVLLLADYGYPRHEYYHTGRNQGTLICHYRHRAHPDPLFWPGLQDITAFVDFTTLAEAGTELAQLIGYTTQADFLFDSGLRETLLTASTDDLPAQLKLAAEIKQLTLPAEMGYKFQFMGFSRGLGNTQIPGFKNSSWLHRL